jgi:hypothetical protein
MAFEKMAQYPSDRQCRDKIFGKDKAWISERMMRKMDGAVKKACRGSEASLRAFWREMGVRLRMGARSVSTRSGLAGHQMGHRTPMGTSLIAMPSSVC